jgi:hypothetical protein
LPNGTAEALVAKLRSQSAACPIALLTGKAGSKDVDEKALVAAIEQHGLLFLQKPVVAADRGLSHTPEFEWAKHWSRNFYAINNLVQALVAQRIIGTRLKLKLAATTLFVCTDSTASGTRFAGR